MIFWFSKRVALLYDKISICSIGLKQSGVIQIIKELGFGVEIDLVVAKEFIGAMFVKPKDSPMESKYG